MRLIEPNWNPTHGQLKQFGILCLFALPFVGWFWFSGNEAVIGGLAFAGFVVAISAFSAPRLVRPFFVGLMLLASPIGMVLGEVAMVAIYFIVFLPIGIVFRLMNRDRLCRKIERETTSYWVKKRQPSSIGSYYRQS